MLDRLPTLELLQDVRDFIGAVRREQQRDRITSAALTPAISLMRSVIKSIVPEPSRTVN
jgi:hypothetical protein